MSVRARGGEGGALTAKQKLSLLIETGGCLADDENFTYEMLVEKNVRAKHLRVAGLGPRWLKERGCSDAFGLRRLGFDSLDLNSSGFLESAVAAFGAADVAQAFVACGEDATNLVNTEAANALQLGPNELLTACAGDPTSALEILQILPSYELTKLNAEILLDTGCRALSLKKVGLGAVTLRHLGPVALQKLGFL